MRTTMRALFATLLAIPLAVTVAVGPSAAAAPDRATETIETIESVYTETVVGILDGIPGNSNLVTVWADSSMSTYVGSAQSYNCPQAGTDPWGAANAECTWVDTYCLRPTAYGFQVGPRLRYGSIAGTVEVYHPWYLEETLATVQVDLLVTSEGRLTTTKTTEVCPDPDGTRCTVTRTISEARGPVTGTIDGLPVMSKLGVIKVESTSYKVITR